MLKSINIATAVGILNQKNLYFNVTGMEPITQLWCAAWNTKKINANNYLSSAVASYRWMNSGVFPCKQRKKYSKEDRSVISTIITRVNNYVLLETYKLLFFQVHQDVCAIELQ